MSESDEPQQMALPGEILRPLPKVAGVPPEEILTAFVGEERDRFNGLLPISVFDALDDRAFEERRSKTDIVILALLDYFERPLRVKPRRSRRSRKRS